VKVSTAASVVKVSTAASKKQVLSANTVVRRES
jgi:hypothetical protein